MILPLSVTSAIARLNELIGEAESAHGSVIELQLRQAILSIAPGSIYAKSLDTDRYIHEETLWKATALRDDLQRGYGQTLISAAHSDVSADLIDYAEDLLSEHHTDPAILIAGGALESHLRRLADLYGVPYLDAKRKPIAPTTLNQNLVKAGAYDGIAGKQVTYWQGVRNEPAHGHYNTQTEDQVNLMLQGILQFVSAHPA
jgi:hypothetical protein